MALVTYGAGLDVELGDVDVVISGGGNLDAYYMGVQQILSRVQRKSNLTLHR